MVGGEGRVRRKRRSADEWRALLSRFEGSGLSVAAFCKGQSISVANFRRWRGLLGERDGRDASAPGFVDLGPLAPALPVGSAPTTRPELTLELGGGVLLHPPSSIVKYHRQSRWLEVVSASKAPMKP